MADDPKNQPTPSMKDFDYFSSHAKPAKHIDPDSLPDSLEEQMERYRALKSRGARQVFFAALFFVVCGWFLWGYRDLIVYMTTGSEEPIALGDVAELDPVNIPYNAYVKLTGITEHRGMQQKIIRGLNFSQEEFWYFRLLGSRGVWIETDPDPEKYGLATQVTVTGRAVDPRRDHNYDELLATYQAKYFSEERPNMRIIQVGVRPGEGQGTLLVVVAVFVLVAALNVYSIVRYIKQLKQKPPVPGSSLMAFMQGGHIVARALKNEQVSHLFTLCGGHIQMIYDGCVSEGIRVVDTRHEQSAAHAADGWARATGRPGVAAVTAGPGVTDAVTAVANAQRAQVPMILIGGQGARMLSQFGGQDRGSLQDMNHVELMRSITKWSVSVPETRRLGEYVQTAFRVATTGVPGPVFLEMPLDILIMGADENDVIRYDGYRTEARIAGDPEMLDKAADAIAEAERPMLIVGSQWRWSKKYQALQDFLKGTPAPTFVNGMARGALATNDPCRFTRSRKDALAAADVVVIFGTPLDFRLQYGEAIGASTTLIQVDLDGAEIGRNRRVDVGIVGDTGLVLQGLADRLTGRAQPDRSGWLAAIRQAEDKRTSKMRAELEAATDPINPLYLCARLNKHMTPKTIVVGDGGDFVATAAYTLDVQGVGSWMDPGPLGTLGVGPGYAMAAKLAKPDHSVVLVSGDGSFGLNGFEFEAMARQGIKVTCVIGNDGAWTQIRRGQIDMYGEERAVATALTKTRYDIVAQGLGCHGEHATKAADIDGALQRAFASPLPAVVNVEIGGSDFRKGAISV